MVHRLSQTEFAPLEPGSPSYAETVVVHRHAEKPETTQSIVFVHGLNGQRYGTWGKYPELLFGDLPDVDLAMYDYASGFRRVHRKASMGLRDHATLLAETIRDEEYGQTVLVGHSMGGLLCMAAVRKMIEAGFQSSDGGAAIDRVAGLVLMATPMAGSLRVFPPFGSLGLDGKVLRAHSDFVTSIHECFTDKVMNNIRCSKNAPSGEQYCIPTFSVVGLKDVWADRFSAGVNIPMNQKKHSPKSHTVLQKPTGPDDDVYNWVRQKIAKCFDHADQCPGRGKNSERIERDPVSEVRMSIEVFDRLFKQLPEDQRAMFRPQEW